jgi:hypothetical protein
MHLKGGGRNHAKCGNKPGRQAKSEKMGEMCRWQYRQADGVSGHRMDIIAYPPEPLKTASGDRIVNYWEDILREI